MEQPVSVAAPAAPLFKKRKAPSSQTPRKRPATPPPAASSSDSDSDDASSDDNDSTQPSARIKRRKTAGIAATTKTQPSTNDPSRPTDLKPGEFAAEANTTIAVSNDATRQSNWQDLDSAPKPNATRSDAKSLLGSTRALPSKDPANDAPKPTVGPQKAPSTVRMITVTDFAPDVCKDYKQTGFCGFGDSCKFLHAREDYKQGWELDKDWEIGSKGNKKTKGTTVGSRAARGKDEVEEADEEMLESIPFACVICKESYKNPIVTKCGHYFCEACALKRYRKNPNCAICGTGTGGVFNGARGLKKLLERKKEREKKRREEEGEEEEASGDEAANGADD